jgi:Na+-transporting methylmalonyl-CoA/oxaloacetate decarboxylase gamma subunit
VEIADALTVALAGMGVVFLGLIVTSLIISAVGYAPKKIEQIFGKRKRDAGAVAARPVIEKVDPDVLAVITTVLEVERRLQFSFKASKLTFKGMQPRSGLI